MDSKWIRKKEQFIIDQMEKNNALHGDLFPEPASEDSYYQFGGNHAWTPSFWTGMQFLAYDVTGKLEFKEIIQQHLDSFDERLAQNVEMDNHDIGFYYSLSHILAYRNFQRGESYQTIIQAADKLMERYEPNSKIIQAWGDKNDPSEQGRMIIDCNMNLFLLYNAFYLTGKRHYYEVAYNHIKRAQEYLVRSDFSTYHTYYFDVQTGEPIRGITAQGYSDQSCWARGQAWAVYGFALNYRYTKDCSLLETAIQTAEYFIQRLPQDQVPYWDLVFTEGNQYRDSSSGAILACGLLEIANLLPMNDEKIERYQKIAQKILESLGNHYLVDADKSNGILLHGVYSIPHNLGVDECCLWGDYFFFEALERVARPWRSFW